MKSCDDVGTKVSALNAEETNQLKLYCTVKESWS